MNKNKSNRDFAANRVRKTLKFEPDLRLLLIIQMKVKDFTENIFREAVNHMDARRQHKESLESVTKATHPFGIFFMPLKRYRETFSVLFQQLASDFMICSKAQCHPASNRS